MSGSRIIKSMIGPNSEYLSVPWQLERTVIKGPRKIRDRNRRNENQPIHQRSEKEQSRVVRNAELPNFIVLLAESETSFVDPRFLRHRIHPPRKTKQNFVYFSPLAIQPEEVFRKGAIFVRGEKAAASGFCFSLGASRLPWSPAPASGRRLCCSVRGRNREDVIGAGGKGDEQHAHRP